MIFFNVLKIVLVLQIQKSSNFTNLDFEDSFYQLIKNIRKIGVSYILSCLKIGDGRKMYPDLFLPHEWKQKVFSVLFSEPRIFMLQLL